ncbi:staphylococcal nuclease domain-containing protein 1 [Bradysia coprophila]|uniref:staphylococcal nuclease domain-containing protein 1 n=1 Tax=Bradysia coprophila TaxID=38358 RepID=UPI00187DCBCF|nr:staphylococcal nuclease domain-containing protein 1 [Bradysia coprophila]
MSGPQENLTNRRGVVKQVLSGDSVIIRGQPKGGPPPEKQINFTNVIAPKLARRPNNANDDSRDEPWAWEAREFLRAKLIGEEVYFSCERPPNSTRDYGTLYIGSDPNTSVNVTELMVSEGLLSVRREGVRITEELQKLITLEDAARAAGKGKWGTSPTYEHVRNIKWTQENPRNFVDQANGKPIRAIIEHVRDGSTVRAFLLPDFQYITLMISGIRCPGFKLDADGKPDPKVQVKYAEEARYFVESRLLQREVEIVLESVNNASFVGTILFPKGNIAEALLREGFAKCVDWSMAFMKTGADKLRLAERQAKEKKVRVWEDYQSNAQIFTGKEKDFTGTVIEVFNGDAINVKTTAGSIKKVFIASIRPPREAASVPDEEGKIAPRPAKKTRPLYDVPWMFEAREFLRKKLIGKKVQCNLDYISPARDNFPEKCCYTVTVGGVNVAEAMVGKGLATVVRYRQDDDQRSSRYDELLTAEAQAVKGSKGVHSKKEGQSHRINDLTVDHSRIKQQYLPSWQRALRTEAIVEFIASGSRFRVYIPKDSCLVTFLLGGITCPRSSRPSVNGAPAQEAQPYGDEALAYVRDKILQRDVSIHIESTDRNGQAVIGWLWTDSNVNLSVALVEEGLASVHFSAEKSDYARQLKTAEDSAKAQRKNIWSTYVEEEKTEEQHDEKEDKVTERKVNHEKVLVTEIVSDLKFFAQHTEQGAKLESLMAKLRQDFQVSPPITGAYTPKRGDLCAAQFSEDNEWYRAKIEKVQGTNISVFYVDYGNKETVPSTRLATLPPAFSSDKFYASEYSLAFCKLPTDEDDITEAGRAFAQDALNRKLLLNVEYRVNGAPFVSLTDPDTNADVFKGLVTDGLLLVEKRREKRLSKLIDEYKAAEDLAKKQHLGIWEYGDITEDDHDGR